MAAERPNTIQLEIFGQVYSLKAGKEPGYIEHIAAYVDAQMREVSRAAGAVDSMKIAVLAALNIADELFKAKLAAHEAEGRIAKLEEEGAERVRAVETMAGQRVREAEGKAGDKAAQLARALDEALGDEA